MIIYEVEVVIQPAQKQAFEEWIQEHMQKLLSQPGFLSAACFERAGLDPTPLESSLVLHYTLNSASDLETYLNGPAVALREEGLVRFGHQMRVIRRSMLTPQVLAKGSTRLVGSADPHS